MTSSQEIDISEPMEQDIKFPAHALQRKKLIDEVNARSAVAHQTFPVAPTPLDRHEDVYVDNVADIQERMDRGYPLVILKNGCHASVEEILTAMRNGKWTVFTKDRTIGDDIFIKNVPTSFVSGSQDGLQRFFLLEQAYPTRPENKLIFRTEENFYKEEVSTPHIARDHYTRPHIDPLGAGGYIMLARDSNGSKIWRCARTIPEVGDYLYVKAQPIDWTKIPHMVVKQEPGDILFFDALICHEVWTDGLAIATSGYYTRNTQENMAKMLLFTFLKASMIHQGGYYHNKLYESIGLSMWMEFFWRGVYQNFFTRNGAKGVPQERWRDVPYASTRVVRRFINKIQLFETAEKTSLVSAPVVFSDFCVLFTLLLVNELCYEDGQRSGFNHEDEFKELPTAFFTMGSDTCYTIVNKYGWTPILNYAASLNICGMPRLVNSFEKVKVGIVNWSTKLYQPIKSESGRWMCSLCKENHRRTMNVAKPHKPHFISQCCQCNAMLSENLYV